MLSGSTYGTVATLTCNTGYTLVGPSSMTCLQDGRWSYNPACSIKSEYQVKWGIGVLVKIAMHIYDLVNSFLLRSK
ncbi:hypothetical protein DPMN_075381 [Dreissena polymorpha]|uniref:Sushi domain-containing protein n=1 Tax=Dreissena polymorpha TaxID=45954 RepID=A0A9D3YJG1_DREPO|nr:hypothetical protein DPMN_075381 [Dreissena polymorpha]